MVAPDDKMDSPIENLMFWANKIVQRAKTYSQFSDAERECLPNDFWQTEDELRQAYIVTLRLRWKEVAEHCESVGLTGCTREMIFDNPFLVAVAYAEHLGLNEEKL